jgi:hypothetical protein
MSRRSQILFLIICVAFSICIFGLIGDIAYDLFDVLAHHHSLEFVLGHSIEFYKSLGAGFAFFLALLVSAVSSKHKGENPK